MTKTLIGIGNAAIDGTVEVTSDEELAVLGCVKGTCVFVDGQDPRMIAILNKYPDYKIDPGGAAANAIACYGALGGTARFIGKCGQDDYGAYFTQNIKKFGVAFDTKPTTEVESTFLFSVITPDRERSFLSNHGASHEISPDDVDETWFAPDTSLIIDGYMLMSGGGPEANRTAMNYAEANGSEIIFMPCSLTVIEEKRSEVDEIVNRADAIICNEDEGNAIAPNGDYKNLIDLFSWGAVTLGEKGVWIFKKGSTSPEKGQKPAVEGPSPITPQGGFDDFIVPITTPPPYIENTNGAGDNFAGGFLYGLHHGMHPKDAAKLGHACAAHVLGKTGARCDFDLRYLIAE